MDSSEVAIRAAAALAALGRSDVVLVCLLESSGFSWMLLPRRQVAREALAHQASNPQSPKVWCTRKALVQKAVQRFYLLALATAAEKRSEALVLHGMPEAYYRAALGLERRRWRPDVSCTGNALLLADDGEPLEDDEDQPPPARRCRRPRDESDATLDVYAEVFDDNGVDAIAYAAESADGESSDSSTADVDQSGLAREEVATHREQDADCVWAHSLAEPPLAALMGELSDMVPAAARIRDPSVFNHNWGAFRFTLKALRSSTGRPGFAWQCACRYHRKNDRTGCKKVHCRARWPRGVGSAEQQGVAASPVLGNAGTRLSRSAPPCRLRSGP